MKNYPVEIDNKKLIISHYYRHLNDSEWVENEGEEKVQNTQEKLLQVEEELEVLENEYKEEISAASVKFSTKSWHFQFMKFVLGSLSPTPENMFNLCPYFWLLVFSILGAVPIVIFKYIFKGLAFIFIGINWLVDKSIITPTAESWHNKLSDLDVYQIWDHNMKINRAYRMIHSDKWSHENWMSRSDFAEKWWKAKYNKEARNHKGQLSVDFRQWNHEMQEQYDNLQIKRSIPSKFEDSMDDLRTQASDWIYDLGQKITSYRMLIKWTKRTVGLIITSLGLVATYFVVNFLGRGILYLIEHWNWEIAMDLGIGVAGVCIIITIYWVVSSWVGLIKEKGLTLWYAKLVYYPLYWVVYMPLKVVGYYFMWQIVLLNIWALIKGGARIIWGSILGFLGIFGDYFGASYSDYCPGIEWTDVEK